MTKIYLKTLGPKKKEKHMKGELKILKECVGPHYGTRRNPYFLVARTWKNVNLDLSKSKHDPERGQYLTNFEIFDADGKPWPSAVKRSQNHENPLRMDNVHGLVLVQPGTGPAWSRSGFLVIFSRSLQPIFILAIRSVGLLKKCRYPMLCVSILDGLDSALHVSPKARVFSLINI